MNDISKLIIKLNKEEIIWWKSKIKEFRSNTIKDPKAYVIEIMEIEKISKVELKKDVEKYLIYLRESIWQKYLIDETIFHKKIIAFLLTERNLPKNILNSIIENELVLENYLKYTREELLHKISKVVGDTAGVIMPYIYELSLSSTQSRRSRAGKVFERIIETFFEIFGYEYGNQSSIGNAAYNSQRLGKKVDLIVPNISSYISNRPKCAVITMKTTLRERWQEVAEELSRTNVPHIYLLTVDDTVTSNTVEIMKQYNITLVLYKKSKEKTFSNHKNTMDYEEFFIKEIPHILSYWKN